MSDACSDHVEHGSAAVAQDSSAWWWHDRKLRAAGLAGVLLLAGLVAGRAGAADRVALVLEAAALVVGGWTFVPGTLRALARGRIGVGTLMTIAATGAVVLGAVEEAAALAFLYSVAEGLEDYALTRTRQGLRALLSLVPEQATVVRDSERVSLPVADLRRGDVLLVRPGGRVATDGVVRAGRTSLDTSAITGESVPVEVGPGEAVYAGSINGSGVIEVEATATAEDNSLARIVRIVEAEQSRRGTSQRLADRIAAPMVPGIMILAAAIAVIGSMTGDPLTWVERALVVLVAASPCALAISVPVTTVAAIGAASRIGALVKGGAALEALGSVRTVALDKTGTLTRNQPAVIDVVTVPGASRGDVLGLAAALEEQSEHPLARAILAATPSPAPAVAVAAVPGAGLVGTVGGAPVRLGRPGWLEPGELASEVERMEGAGQTVVLVEHDGEVIGAVGVRDELRSETLDVVDQLRQGGHRVAMLTGDNQRTAAALAIEAGIDTVHADLRPEDKATLVSRLRAEQPTAMVGDGVNDAPALAAADLGIAIGAMGSDVAIETADVALMGDDLRHLPRTFQHARRARRIIRQNLGLSLAIVAVLIPLAVLGVLGLAAIVLVHEIAEIAVIANGIRASHVPPLAPTPGGGAPPEPQRRAWVAMR